MPSICGLELNASSQLCPNTFFFLKGCLAGTYFQCCEQWFCFDKSIALYPTNETITNQNLKQNDNFNHPYSWTEDTTAKVIIREPKANNEEKIVDAVTSVDENHVTSDNSTTKDENEQQTQTPKNTLQERRKSASELKLTIDDRNNHRSEIPVIRQQTVPKFYLGSPEISDTEINTKSTENWSFEDIVPRKPLFHFDLKTIADMNLEPIPIKKRKNNSFTKLFHLKQKLKPFSNNGSKSMPNFAALRS